MEKKYPDDRWSYLWLVLAFGLSLFSSGRWVMPVSLWLGLTFMLRFFRTQPPLRAFFLGWGSIALALYPSWEGIIPLPRPAYILFIAFAALCSTLPYLVDRLLVSRIKKPISILVFPASFTTMDYLVSLGPFGSWNVTAYSQWGNLPFLQVLSLTGLWGISFIISWFASTVNWAWEKKFHWKKFRRPALVFLVSLTMVLVWGGARLSLYPPASPTVHVAAVTAPGALPVLLEKALNILSSPSRTLDNSAWEPLREMASQQRQEMLELTRNAAQTGAACIAWSEGSTMVLADERQDFLIDASRVSREQGIYLAATMLMIDPQKDRPVENTVVLFNPNGESEWEVQKVRPVPGLEDAVTERGSDYIPVSNTSIGRIGAVVCFDADFPQLFRRPGKEAIDILIVPSSDWLEITPHHAYMAVFRALEQGFSILRPTSNGLTLASDYQGRVLSQVNSFHSQTRVMHAHLPVKGTATVYGWSGDLFPWGCVFLLAALVSLTVRRSKKRKRYPRERTKPKG